MNRVTHFEIPADDEARAEEFYKKAFGWKLINVPVDGMNYHMMNTGPTTSDGMVEEKGFINGGMFKRTKNEKTMIVIDVKDINEAIQNIKNAGGELVMEPGKVGDMGLYARFKDSEGNLLGLWQTIKSD